MIITIKQIMLFQSVLENLPGVDPQSEAVRQAVGAMTSSTSSDDKKKEGEDDKKKKEGDKK